MSWLFFSFLNAFFESISNAFGKQQTKHFDSYSILWSQRLFAVLILLPFVFFTHSLQTVNTTFWLVTISNALLNTGIFILFYKALKESPLSLSLPIATLTPVFLLITSPLIVGEFPKPLGILGIITTVIGSYVLNLSKRHESLWEPLVSIIREKGTRHMLLVAFLWSITSNIDKIGVQNSNPILYAFTGTFFILLFSTIVVAAKKISFIHILKNSITLAPVGIATGISTVAQMTALSVTIVPNVITVKRTSTIFGVIWGKLFFKEEKMKERLLGASIMVLGVIFIALN